jgi:hypothetical protein
MNIERFSSLALFLVSISSDALFLVFFCVFCCMDSQLATPVPCVFFWTRPQQRKGGALYFLTASIGEVTGRPRVMRL